MSEYKPNLTINVNEPKLVKFLFNEPIGVTTKFGQRYRYTLSHNGVEHQILATSTLHALIMHHAPLRDKELTINKIKVDDKITAFTINGMTMDDLKKKANSEFTSVLDGSKDATPTPTLEPYNDDVPFNKYSVDDCWREINKIQKALKNVMQSLENLEEGSKKEQDVPF